MDTPSVSELAIRDQLRTKRNLLFDALLNNPSNTPLAIEIKSIDDWIAELTGQIIQRQKLERAKSASKDKPS